MVTKRPTEEGTKFFDRITKWLTEFDSIQQEVLGQNQAIRSTLKITTNVLFNHIFLTDIVSRFFQRNEHIQLEVLVTDRAVDMVPGLYTPQ